MEKTLNIETSYKSFPDNRDLDHIPGDYGLPFLGTSVRSLFHFKEQLHEHYRRYGPVSRMSQVGQRALLVLDPDINQQILLDQKRNFSSEMGYERTMAKFFHGGLMLRDFDEHRIHRRIMLSAFKTETLKSYAPAMNDILHRGIQQWQELDQPLVFYFAIKELLLSVAAKIFIGVDDLGNQAKNLNQAFLDTVEGLRSIIRLEIPGLLYYKARKARRYLVEYFKEKLPEKRVDDGQDMFSLFSKERMENGELFSDEDVIDHMCFLMMAAHDTTTSSITSSVYELAHHTEWQEKLREEALALNAPVLAHGQQDQQTYMDLFFQELLRLRWPVPMLMRRTVEDCDLGGYDVPAHTIIGVAPAFSHFLEDWWDMPEKFDPMRFSSERAEHKRHTFSYIPFGGGAHKCIGVHFATYQTKAFLHQLLIKYRIRLKENYQLKFVETPFPHPKDYLPIYLEPLH